MFPSPDIPEPPPPTPAPDTGAAQAEKGKTLAQGRRRKGRGANELTSPLGAEGYDTLGAGVGTQAQNTKLGGTG